MSIPAPQKLGYAPPPPKSRKIARRTLIGFTVVCVAIVLVKLIPAAWMRIQLVYWQSKCMSYQAPPDQQVVDWAQFKATGRAGVIPVPWQRFYTLLSPPGANSSGTLFLHERTSSSGKRRLIAVDMLAWAETRWDVTHFFDIRLIKPGSIVALPAEITSVKHNNRITMDHYTIYHAGQPDQSDPSHFTIRALTTEIGGAQVEWIIDGWLTDDDRVILEPRTQLKSPSTKSN